MASTDSPPDSAVSKNASPAIKRALISVSDKSDLVPFAERLVNLGVEIFSTGGTRKRLAEAGLEVRDIADYTGFPEMMDGRLKTLHPKIFGGLLARHDRPDDMSGLEEHGIQTFELVVVNLYPFEQTIARAGVTDAEAIEQIDIGGPSLVRAAAKNHAFTTIVTAPDQYESVLDEIAETGSTTLATRRSLAGAAFAKTANYDAAIADYFARNETGPESLRRQWQKKSSLRYGENPHQEASVYVDLNLSLIHI